MIHHERSVIVQLVTGVVSLGDSPGVNPLSPPVSPAYGMPDSKQAPRWEGT